jgi:hypothetical protein
MVTLPQEGHIYPLDVFKQGPERSKKVGTDRRQKILEIMDRGRVWTIRTADR